MKEEIKIGDWVRHNYCNIRTIEIFKVGRIEGDEVYNDEGTSITQGSHYVYLHNCKKMTKAQMVYIDVWNDRI